MRQGIDQALIRRDEAASLGFSENEIESVVHCPTSLESKGEGAVRNTQRSEPTPHPSIEAPESVRWPSPE
jgi:hypothetical protein